MRGDALLLDHCHRLGRITGSDGLRARDRLTARVGGELAELLVRALVGGRGLGPVAERLARPAG